MDDMQTAINTITAKLNEALQKEKETEGTEATVIWHLVAKDYQTAISAMKIQMRRPMSNDLISRSALIEELYKRVGSNLSIGDLNYLEKIIDDAPTAYNIGGVVNEIVDYYDLVPGRFLKEIIEIVKNGGKA